MKKKIVIALMAASISSVAQAATLSIGASKTTQDLKVFNASTSYDNTGLYLDWRSDKFLNTDKIKIGLLWNTATAYGRVLEAYLMPKVNLTDKVSAFGRIGYSLSGAQGSNGGSMAWGIGGSYAINPNWAVEIGYDKLYDNDPWTMSAINMGVNFKY